MKEISRGAEAVIFMDNNEIIKKRVKKSYRISKLDKKIRSQRTKHETTLLRRAKRSGVSVPRIINEEKYSFTMEFIEGSKIKDILSSNNYIELSKKMAENIAKLHEFNIIHGDLTTSNMILKNNDIYLIDFGLGFHSQRTEDKAVDLHLLKEALVSTHFNVAKEAWKLIIDEYEKNYESGHDVVARIKQIEKRGRYLH